MNVMRCKKCGGKAAVQMKQHNLALCREHFSEWFVEQTERTIHKYRMFKKDERVLVAVSGGKDSLALWDVLAKLGYDTVGLYIHLGIEEAEGYSDHSLALAQAFAAARGLRLEVTHVPQRYGESIPQMAARTARGRHRACSVCGVVKRHSMNEAALRLGCGVLATGHNLDDEAAVLFNNTLSWSVDMLLRQSPVLPESPGFPRKVKPLCRFYERESAAYAILNGIEYVYEECPHAVGSTSLVNKALLNQLEQQSPGSKLRFYSTFLKAKAQGAFASAGEGHAEPPPLQFCPSCGQPTTTAGLCLFCRLVGGSAPQE